MSFNFGNSLKHDFYSHFTDEDPEAHKAKGGLRKVSTELRNIRLWFQCSSYGIQQAPNGTPPLMSQLCMSKSRNQTLSYCPEKKVALPRKVTHFQPAAPLPLLPTYLQTSPPPVGWVQISPLQLSKSLCTLKPLCLSVLICKIVVTTISPPKV